MAKHTKKQEKHELDLEVAAELIAYHNLLVGLRTQAAEQGCQKEELHYDNEVVNLGILIQRLIPDSEEVARLEHAWSPGCTVACVKFVPLGDK